MPYPEAMVAPMREELTRLGVEELTDAATVDAAFEEASGGTMLLVINSVCGCAAANARPAVALAKQADHQPDRYATVFAGQDLDATERARAHLAGVPPSSPFMALFKDGDPVYVIERRHIEGRSANAIAADLEEAFAAHCDPASSEAAGEGAPERPEGSTPGGRPETAEASNEENGLPSTFRSIK